jgi:hypothetical protein
MPAIDFTLSWPIVEGHSGGGVYLWNADKSRLELVGIVHGQIPMLYGEHWMPPPNTDSISVRPGLDTAILYVPVAEAAKVLRKRKECRVSPRPCPRTRRHGSKCT